MVQFLTKSSHTCFQYLSQVTVHIHPMRKFVRYGPPTGGIQVYYVNKPFQNILKKHTSIKQASLRRNRQTKNRDDTNSKPALRYRFVTHPVHRSKPGSQKRLQADVFPATVDKYNEYRTNLSALTASCVDFPFASSS